MYWIVRFLLFLLPAEFSHYLSLHSLKLLHRLGLLNFFINKQSSELNLLGLPFNGRVGLAAGLDKNGEYIDALAALGFDFIEIGTITPKPQAGNPKPRLFRLKSDQALINRMGFNNKGVDYLVEQVKRSQYQGVLGINIGKNKNTPNEQALDDYLICMEKVYKYASYITVNLSSPNTPGLRDLQFGEALENLLSALKKKQHELHQQYNKRVPLFVKISPDLVLDEVQQIAQILLRCHIDGVIATNTTIDKKTLQTSSLADEQGGLSGQPLADQSTKIIQQLTQYLRDEIVIIGVGGIHDVSSSQEKINAGASLVQVYTGFIYQGPTLIKKIRNAINY